MFKAVEYYKAVMSEQHHIHEHGWKSWIKCGTLKLLHNNTYFMIFKYKVKKHVKQYNMFRDYDWSYCLLKIFTILFTFVVDSTSYNTDVCLSHVTDFGQKSVSRCNKCHFWEEALRIINHMVLLSAPLPATNTACSDVRLLFSSWILEEDIGNKASNNPSPTMQSEQEVIIGFVNNWYLQNYYLKVSATIKNLLK